MVPMDLPPVDDASRLFCVGRNFADHAREMGAERPRHPVIFLKPGSARVPPGPVRLPCGLGRVDFEGELTLLLSGREAQPFAGVGLGVDLTLREAQSRLKQDRLPWTVAKAFDGSALLGPFMPWPADLSADLSNLCFETRVNGESRQQGYGHDMLFTPAELISALSRFWCLRAGDVLFTGTPAGVGPLHPGDVIELAIRQPEMGGAAASWQMEKA
ncbi:fumarylpyruvate hydrolase [Natronospira proteinivora]|uniref:Fumarylpyruvate hydrolase n=1 Tax=Natronospira proteinivora TaxID=1807133 RepID=A0ABT1G9L7_9GAMM|nr:fumarylacetoacetate hydrolase family protein [Natronospira proteinivora]MCP1728014.1 fumarylpyruvate hydrolase [Natronospira proteinivora]